MERKIYEKFYITAKISRESQGQVSNRLGNIAGAWRRQEA